MSFAWIRYRAIDAQGEVYCFRPHWIIRVWDRLHGYRWRPYP